MTSRAQVVDLVVGQAKAAQDLLVVLAKRRRGGTVVPVRSWRHRERPARIPVHAGDRVLDLLVETAGVELGDVIHPIGRQHMLDRKLVCAQMLRRFRRRSGSAPTR